MSVITRDTNASPDAGGAITPGPSVATSTGASGAARSGALSSRFKPMHVGPQTVVTVKADQAAGLRDLVAAFHQDVVTSMQTPSTTAATPPPVAPPVPAVPSRVATPAPARAPFQPASRAATPVATPAPSPRLRRVPIVAVTSGKGGVGKTSIAVNICAILAQRHVRTTLIDADMGLANADVLCGLSPIHRLDAAVPVLRPGADARPLPRSMRSIALEAPGGFRLVPGSVGVSRMANLAGAERVALLDAMLELEHDNDLIVVDTGAGLSDGVMTFVRHADLAVVVVTPEPTSIADAYATMKLLRTSERAQHATRSTKVAIVVNMAHSEVEASATFERLRGTCQRFLKFEPVFLGMVSADQAVPVSIRARVPMAVASPSARPVRELKHLADRVATEAGVKLVDRAKPAPSWWSRWTGRSRP